MVTYENANSFTIEGVNINKNAADLQNLENVSQVAALRIFRHLDNPGLEEELELEVFNFMRALSSIIPPEWSVVHTNGVKSRAVGVTPPLSSSNFVGVGLDGSYNLTFQPGAQYWDTEPVPRRMKKFICKTNIVENDCADNVFPSTNGIVIAVYQAYKDSPTSATSGARSVFEALKSAPFDMPLQWTAGVVTSGPSYVGNIGDLGTYYFESVVLPNAADHEIGTAGPNGSGYYAFEAVIGENVNSKTYKFQMEIEYV
jgi:hypothetical protein